MKVKALGKFEHVLDSTIGRTRKKGEVFEVTEERAKVLLMNSLVVIEPEKEKDRKAEKMAELDKAIKEQTKKKGGRPKKK